MEQFLSIKNGNNYTEFFIKKFGKSNTLIISADIENQINLLAQEEKKNYMNMIGIDETGLNLLIRKGYNISHHSDTIVIFYKDFF